MASSFEGRTNLCFGKLPRAGCETQCRLLCTERENIYYYYCIMYFEVYYDTYSSLYIFFVCAKVPTAAGVHDT